MAISKTTTSKTSKAKEKVSLRHKKIESRRLLMAIFVILLLMIALTLFNFLTLVKTRNELKTYVENSQAEVYKRIEKAVAANDPLVAGWRSFGDSFSSYAYLDMSKTTMVLDDKETALVFPPLYDFSYSESCQTADCDLPSADLIFTDTSSNLKANRTPAELKDKNITSSRVDKLNLKRVASFIVSENGEERAYVYFFDGNNFTPLITNKTDVQMITKYGRPGGVVAVGGDDDDFLIIYAGYEGHAAHYKNGSLEDVSRFFGLRVADSGFSPYIIKQGLGKDSVWYILSLNSTKPKLIKLWQNGGDKIMGAYDFSSIFADIDGAISAFHVGEERGELEFIIKSADKFSLRRFADQGFDNSINRVAQSVNLNSTEGLVKKAKIDSIGIYGEAEIFLADKEQGFITVKAGRELTFGGQGRELFWRVDFPKSSDNEYSPWLEHVNYLNYYVAGE